VNRNLRAYLNLVRLPNLFTAAADVFAGFFYAGAWLEEWSVLLRLSIASMCLYAGGVALNDVCDAEQDAAHRPDRPIPAGHIPVGRALQLTITAFIAGVALAASVSWMSGLVASLLVAAIVGYDALLKPTSLAPPAMGLCRALNLALGMYGVTDFAALAVLRPIAVVWLYVTAVTFFARTEERRSRRGRLAIGGVGQVLAIGGLWTVWRWSVHVRYSEFAWLAAALAFWLIYNIARAIHRPEPRLVQLAVKRSVLALIVLDACIAWSAGGMQAAAWTLALLIPAVVSARFLRVT
jgi:4-hydroxybenzoate polyprenyltransferase